MKKKLTGRPPRVDDIKKSHKLKKKGLSLAQISWIVLKREDKKTIHRWLKLDLKKLSTA